jgi:hypothetical protein
LTKLVASGERIGRRRFSDVGLMHIEIAHTTLDRVISLRRVRVGRLTPPPHADPHAIPVSFAQRRLTARATHPIVREVLFQRTRRQTIDYRAYAFQRMEQPRRAVPDLGSWYYASELDDPGAQRGDVNGTRACHTILSQCVDRSLLESIHGITRSFFTPPARQSQYRQSRSARAQPGADSQSPGMQ